ncbi:DNA-packaging protein [Parvularcula sp. LCG005]|uniref:DNA-packaging protein n=1 Tax=Parvularcula sp. LCG005 TaxID=3078805 RepID=UPI002942E225|nr:terminase family protein [Parvularcula sp. LCG005]WOI53989.1 terminase family protein [Parvularcula sp. LCG005]
MSSLDDFEKIAPGNAIYDWTLWARDDQLPDPQKTDWTTWLLMGGRGAGKTRAGAEWLAAQVRGGAARVALVGETYEDAREVMIDGPSGLCAIGNPAERPVYEASRHRLSWPSGAIGHVFSAEDPEGLRGFQFEAAWADELCKWRQAEQVWSNLQLGLRLGDRPRQVVTTTPRSMPLMKRLLADRRTLVSRATSFDNKAHLAEAFFTEIASTYEGTALGRQELYGEMVEDRAGALWSWQMIEAARIANAPPLDRIVVAIDPPVTSGPDADECGIIVAGVAGEGAARTAYVLADGTVHATSAAMWAERAVALYHAHGADRMIAEVNQGGDLVEEMIRLADPAVPIRQVRATRNKMVRAEPVSALYEKGRVRHVGEFAALESQLTAFTGTGREKSPDRLDALVWALTDLMLGHQQQPAIRVL